MSFLMLMKAMVLVQFALSETSLQSTVAFPVSVKVLQKIQ